MRFPSPGPRAVPTPTLIWFLVLWGAVEATALLVLPSVLPWTRYLEWFQPTASHASVRTFLDGDHILVPDDWTGWRSAPAREQGLWQTDSLGSRPAGVAPWGDPEALNVLFTGSSMMNGGGAVRNSETIPAFLEGDAIRTLNFAAMLFGVDQVLLDYRARLRHFEPDVLVVGVDADPYGALHNIWVPLRRPEEHNMPFVKPRFVLDADSLILLQANPRELLTPDGRPRLVEAVQADGYVDRFSRFVHMEQTPLLSLVSWGTGVVARRLTGFEENPETVRLLERILDELRREVEAEGTRLLLVAMPLGSGAQPAPQVEAHAARVAGWRARGFGVVDVEAVLDGSGLGDTDLYLPDGVHLSATGNRLVAGAIGEALSRSLVHPTDRRPPGPRGPSGADPRDEGHEEHEDGSQSPAHVSDHGFRAADEIVGSEGLGIGGSSGASRAGSRPPGPQLNPPGSLRREGPAPDRS